MSEQKVETKPGDTVKDEAAGTGKTAVETVAVEPDEAKPGEVKPAVAEGQTAFAAAGETKPDEAKPGDEPKPGEVKPGEETKPEDDKGKKKEGEADAPADVLADIKLPEGFVIADADKAALSEAVTKHNLPKEAVQELVDLQIKREQLRMETARVQQQEFISSMRAEAEKLPKETLIAANRFVQKYGSKGLQAKMADPAFYIGNDVDIITALAIAQKAVEGGFVDNAGGGGGAKVVSAADLYPNSGMK